MITPTDTHMKFREADQLGVSVAGLERIKALEQRATELKALLDEIMSQINGPTWVTRMQEIMDATRAADEAL